MTLNSHPYFTFNGNCREAMGFYKSCFGGELTFQTIGDSPLSNKMPKGMKDAILHATLVNGSMVLLGTDMVSKHGLIKGNAVSVFLQCMSLEHLQTCFNRLAEGGRIEHPLENSFWGALFGDLTDKYGYHWLLSCKNNGCKPNP